MGKVHVNRRVARRSAEKEITLKSIGVIHAPYKELKGMPFSMVKLERVERNTVIFSEVDMLDGTPLLDIKPYVSYFDSRKSVKNGWLERHFKSGALPKRTRL